LDDQGQAHDTEEQQAARRTRGTAGDAQEVGRERSVQGGGGAGSAGDSRGFEAWDAHHE